MQEEASEQERRPSAALQATAAEEAERCNRLIDVLASAGYSGARITTLPAFDRVIGGLAWALTLCSAEFDADGLFREGSLIKHNIKLSESAITALVALECPYPLQAQQIQGLDYAALEPVVRWLVQRAEAMRSDPQSLARGKALLHNAAAVVEEGASAAAQGESQQAVHDDGERRSNMLSAAIDSLSIMQESTRVVADAGHGSDTELELVTEQEQGEDATTELAQLEATAAALKQQMQRLRDAIDADRSAVATMQSAVPPQQQDLHKRLLPMLRDADRAVKAEADFRRWCQTQRQAMQAGVAEAQAATRSGKQDGQSAAETEAALRQDVAALTEQVVAVRQQGARAMRRLALLQRRVDEAVLQDEVLQYQQRYHELGELIEDKLQETRKAYTTYNALADTQDLLKRQRGVLASVHASYTSARGSKDAQQRLEARVKEVVASAEAMLGSKKGKTDALQAQHDALATSIAAAKEQQRSYTKLVGQLDAACARVSDLTSAHK